METWIRTRPSTIGALLDRTLIDRVLLDRVFFDRVVAGAFLAAMAVERIGAASRLGIPLPLALALSAVVAGALAVRRTAPLASYLAGSAALAVEALFVLPSPVSPYANLIGLYTLGRYASRERSRLGPGIVLLGMAAYFAGAAHTHPMISAGALFVWLLTWALGCGAARRREEREAARLLLHRRVADEERARIARELHDMVGRTVNLMLVQAGTARRALPRDPGQTRELLSGLEHSGREVLDELDRVLGLLPSAGSTPDGPWDPQPGLGDLAGLTGRLEQTGSVQVTARVDPAAARLPRSLDLSAYRIVQEALANAVKHGHADAVEITVRHAGDALAIDVNDDGRGVADGYRPGRGLLGIAERVALFGGSVQHGGGDAGGFRVRVLLPIPRSSGWSPKPPTLCGAPGSPAR
ncbi:signal transduction histidine kinase [Kitasatospora sp. MAP12-15]|uniref:sensor histidine kinase n=1 Tax=unclassified Kitasatospora TaxID=2633591 RepID=UPI002475D794|nr:histidine kinase [Kitasatospora sp. MAP12-44]MDH6109355.1 signal transduction histidine kinase [Kitasatospora sp. MAP12-44]